MELTISSDYNPRHKFVSFKTKEIIYGCQLCETRFISCKAFAEHKCKSGYMSKTAEVSCVGKFKGFDNVEVNLVRLSETHINAMKKYLLGKF